MSNLRSSGKLILVSLLGCAAGLVAVALLLSFFQPGAHEPLVTEWVKSLLQFATVVIGGAVLKAVLDESHAARRREEKEQDDERERQSRRAAFRADKLRRLVAGNNRLRRARILIPAYGSVSSYRDQFLVIVSVAADLRAVRHEIDALEANTRELTFTGWNGGWEQGSKALGAMTRYLEALNAEFVEQYSGLSEMQRRAETPGAPRTKILMEITAKMRELPKLQDLLKPDTDATSEFETEYNANYRIVIAGLINSATVIKAAETALGQYPIY